MSFRVISIINCGLIWRIIVLNVVLPSCFWIARERDFKTNIICWWSVGIELLWVQHETINPKPFPYIQLERLNRLKRKLFLFTCLLVFHRNKLHSGLYCLRESLSPLKSFLLIDLHVFSNYWIYSFFYISLYSNYIPRTHLNIVIFMLFVVVWHSFKLLNLNQVFIHECVFL